MSKIRIMFLPLVDAASLNAQSLNIREIVLRLDPQQFECSLFYTQEPDRRLLNCSHIRLFRLPVRLKTIRLLRQMFSGYDIIAYMDHGPASYLYLHIPKRFRKRTKTILHVEGLSELGGESPVFKFLYWGTAPRCDFYTGITDCSARHFHSVVHRDVSRVLPIGVDRQIFSSTRNHKAVSPAVLFVGTLVERKGPLLVLEAARRFPHIKFRMIGPDRYGFAQIVSQRISEQKLSNVVLEGAMPQEAIARSLKESDIFLLPSRFEGLPKVTLEAAASGVPCIVFSDYETPSVVDGVTGFQVNTVDEMMEKLGLLIGDGKLRESMGAAGIELSKQFDWNVIAPLWQDTYLKIASTGA